MAPRDVGAGESVAAKRFAIALLLLSEIAAMATWFATTASVGAIRTQWSLSPFQEALLTNSVQAGFVAGTLVSALLGLADRFDLRGLFCGSAATAGFANLLMLAFEPTSAGVPLLRFVTGACMAGVYPVGMKIAATWAVGDLGLLIGLLVGALTLGSALPHLVAAFGQLDWHLPVLGAALGAFLAAVLVRFVRLGPATTEVPPLSLKNALEAWRNRGVRLANLGYLGHMWELYAMWAWIGAFMTASFREQYGDAPPFPPELAAFCIVAAGAFGAMLGGWAADRFGRTLVTGASMLASGCCAVGIGFLFGGPAWAVLSVGVLWGVAVIADSAQFSAAVSELSDRRLVGTMLTIQTCIGFLLTLVSIQLIAFAGTYLGWRFAFALLAVGPFFGLVSMLRLRRLPEAKRLAGGRR
ncbi:MFS transporter [Methylobacterium nigriterrae]|uniref:MFS transporter n=1 Tax=Methylobacterium nigriterrae TaxID=3127512 RepID=UPI0030134438